MDISPQLKQDVYREYMEDPNKKVGDLREELGWKETQGNQVPQGVATDVKEVVESRTKKLTSDPSFEKMSKLHRTPSKQIQVLKHSQIELGDQIGSGGFNKIFHVRSLPEEDEDEATTEPSTSSSDESGRYVVKVLRQDLADDDVQFALCACDIVKEALFMSALSHKNIVKIRAVSEGGIANFEHGCRPDSFFVVMGKLEETLFDRIQKWKTRFKDVSSRPSDRKDFFSERLEVGAGIVDGLSHMHSLNMIHRDIKPGNLGFCPDGMIKLFDFGLARMVPEFDDPNETFKLSQKSGTHRYISPENYKGEPYNLKSDVYSFTILLYQILSLKLPFKHLKSDEQEVLVFERGARPYIPFCWPRSIQKLVKKGWAQKSSKRPTMEEMKERIYKTLESSQ